MNKNTLLSILLILFLALVGLNVWVYYNNSKKELNEASHKTGEKEHSSNSNSSANKIARTEPVDKYYGKRPNQNSDLTKKEDSLNTANISSGNALEIEKTFVENGLIDVQSLDKTIQTDLRYGTTNNFLSSNMYGGFQKCFLQAEVAEMLAKAQAYIKEQNPKHSLLMLDCTRPRSVQQKMYDAVKGTDKKRYVAYPRGKGSLHNYGVAVDVTIVDENGEELDMGTEFDHFGLLAEPRFNQRYNASGELSNKQLTNRIRLKEVMRKAGFRGIAREWWHFEAFPIETAMNKYKIIE